MRQNIRYMLIYVLLAILTACNVHEWPEPAERVPLRLRLHYETDMTIWEHTYDGSNTVEQHLGDTYANRREQGKIRYIIRVYPMESESSVQDTYVEEFVFTKDIADGYEHEVALDLRPGDYTIRVWSDIVESDGINPHYNATDFGEIVLQGTHEGNNDFRDAFRGGNNVSIVADVVEPKTVSIDIAMQRPMAKFEFISTDVEEFMEREIAREMTKGDVPGMAPDDVSRVDFNDYMVVFSYVGFMPDTYSIYTDKPVDSSTGVMFRSTLKDLNGKEASLGFDYVLVNGSASAVTLQIGLFNKERARISLTDPIKVPVKRNRHTVVRGRFLTSETSGGVNINPDYDDEFNLFFP